MQSASAMSGRIHEYDAGPQVGLPIEDLYLCMISLRPEYRNLGYERVGLSQPHSPLCISTKPG